MEIVRHGPVRIALFLLASAGSACGAGSTDRTEDAPLSALVSAMAESVAECLEARDACEAAGKTDCQEQFRACKDDARDASKPDIERGVATCAEASRSCRKEASTSEERERCGDELHACIDEAKEDRADRGDSASPVAACTAELHACIASDEEAKTCTDALRACIAAARPNSGNGHDDRDPGQGKPDGGAGKRDDAPGLRGRDAGRSAAKP